MEQDDVEAIGPVSWRKRSRSAHISFSVLACVLVRITTLSRFTVLQRELGMRVAAVLIGEIPEAQAVVHALDQEIGEPAIAHFADLIGAVVDAVRAGPLREPGHLDAGLAERHEVVRIFGCWRRRGDREICRG